MPEHYRPVTSSLRSRLLVLTFLFVMAVAVLVYLPSVATFRQEFLEKRLQNAEIAALALEEAPNNSVSPALEERLLDRAGVISIVWRQESKSYLLGFTAMPEEVDATFDLRQPSLGDLIIDAFGVLKAGGERAIRVVGDPMAPGTRLFEITLDEIELYEELSAYSRKILALSIVISLFIGLLVYLSLHWFLVRPMRRVKDSIVAFRRRPEAVTKMKATTIRPDEIGLVERELCRMQEEIRQNLYQKNRLASLGEAVAKINHDLRNILATAQLATDALQNVDHPYVQKVSRRLMTAVSKAVALCENTLRHGKADDPVPKKELVGLAELLADVGVSLGLIEQESFTFDVQISEDVKVYADPEQMHRVFLNLCRNAAEVQGDDGTIILTCNRDSDGTCHTIVTDKGPGIPEAVRPSLFKAFSSARAGGTGLGLATARDIVLAHGGQISLVSTSEDGSSFMVCLPGAEKD